MTHRRQWKPTSRVKQQYRCGGRTNYSCALRITAAIEIHLLVARDGESCIRWGRFLHHIISFDLPSNSFRGNFESETRTDICHFNLPLCVNGQRESMKINIGCRRELTKRHYTYDAFGRTVVTITQSQFFWKETVELRRCWTKT